MDPELFTSPVKSFLLCRICRNVLRNPVLNSRCGHSFCSACLLRPDDGGFNACPDDPDSVPSADSVVPNRSREEGLNELHLRCLYRYSFDKIVASSSADSSRETSIATENNSTLDSLLPCLSRPLRWDDSGCDAEVTLGELNNHLSTCKHRWIKCKQCGESVRAFDIDQHANVDCSALENSSCNFGFDLDGTAGLQASQISEESASSAATTDNQCHQLDSLAAAHSNKKYSTAPASTSEPANLPTIDQLRTLLACQKRLEDLSASLLARVSSLTEQIDSKLDRLVQLRIQSQPVQETTGSTTPTESVVGGGSRDSSFRDFHCQPDAQTGQLNGIKPKQQHPSLHPQTEHEQQKQQQQQQQESNIRLVVMEPSSYSSSASSTSDSESESLLLRNRPAQQPPHQPQTSVAPLEPEWTLPFSLNCTGSFNGHAGPIVHLAIDTATAGVNNNYALYSFAKNGEIRVWDTAGGRCFAQTIWTGDPGASITCAAVTTSSNSSLIIMANSTGSLARLSMAEPGDNNRPPKLLSCLSNAHSCSRPVSALVASSNSNNSNNKNNNNGSNNWLLFTAAASEVRVWRLPQLLPLQHVTNLQRDIGAICLTPSAYSPADSSGVVAQSMAKRSAPVGLLVACRNRICLFGVGDEPEALRLVRMPKNVQFGSPHCLTASPRHVIVGTAKKGIWVLDANLTAQLACLDAAHMGPVKSLACTPSGNWLLSGQLNGTMRVWDLRTWRSVQQSHWHRERVDCLLLVGGTAYSGSADAAIKVYRYTNQKLTPICQQLHHMPFLGGQPC